jgi:anti-sigma factor RsiW
MKTNHLSAWEQEEYVLDQRTPQMLRHLTECAECRAAVAQLEHGVAVFRDTAVEWSADCLAARPRQLQFASLQFASGRRLFTPALRWAIAAVVPLVLLLLLALLPVHLSRPAHPTSEITDDALLEQVDEQVSVAVPSSMESLTHLVSAESSSGVAASGSKHIVQTN